MNQHRLLAVLLNGPPGSEVSPPTANPKPIRGAPFAHILLSSGNKSAGLQRDQMSHFRHGFRRSTKRELERSLSLYCLTWNCIIVTKYSGGPYFLLGKGGGGRTSTEKITSSSLGVHTISSTDLCPAHKSSVGGWMLS